MLCSALSVVSVQTVKRVGVRGLFSGLQPALLGTAVSQGVYFYFYSLLRELAVARKHAAAGTSSLQRSREQELPIGTAPFVCLNVLEELL